MASVISNLVKKKLISPPQWLASNTHYEVIIGSVAYGVSSDKSDMDIYGFTTPPKEMIFPHLAGVIQGFGNQGNRFDQYEQHHVIDPSKGKTKEKKYDLNIMNIVKYFELCRSGNPNMIDSLFVPQNCVLTMTQVGSIVRENRKLFLSKTCWKKFKGYAYGQIKYLHNKEPVGKRRETVEKFGYDVKFAYHIVRLLSEVEQILTTGDLNLQENREQLKSIRRGEWKEQDIYDFFERKEKELETVYLNSKLPEIADENKLRNILMDCLEAHYGSLEKVVVRQDEQITALREINKIIEGLKIKKVL